MEMEASTLPPKAPRPTIEIEEDALVSQVLEIISGVTLEALQALEDPEERDVWSMEEGDDSVFYSDEDQAHQDMKANTCDFGASEREHLVDSVTADEPIPRGEDDQGDESIIDKENSKMEKGVTLQVILTEQGEELQELQAPKTEPMHQSDAAQSNKTPEECVSTCEETLQLKCTQTQSEHNSAAERVNLQVKEEEVLPDAQTPNLQPFDVTNEESCTRQDGEADVPQQMSSAELQVSGDRQLQVDRAEPGQSRDFNVPVGFHQNPSPGYSTLPLPKKPDEEKSFDHLSSSKYSTVSYRKIRRGNTRQKIEQFEYMMMKL